eukprot:CAMPEP_0117025718 /NCGR_PEP_ID=MMETSP0472-20121206/18974_1 /TAXON_ID=693140 ORGANISM="Tiarina fusus, Strain LIS" /NCGR_SAMPLE_ID=MMETSP0472 /ASSEMBLY_ACC=CAM_ASM_000603 /LENGTH=93 /DNA_ID=CAMNT_0004732519 /DNA_START=89 /DNA_END=370 /DNA_ORIENTATION=+
MKFISALLVIASASAFTRPSFVSRPTTAINIIKKSQLDDLESDAQRALFLECNPEECTMVEGTKEKNGWRLDGELSDAQTTTEVLMIETSDTE